MGNVCAHGQEKRTLGPGGEDQLLIGIHRRPGEVSQLFCQPFPQGELATVFRICLGSAQRIPLVEGFNGAGNGRMRVHIPVGEVHGRSGQFFAGELGAAVLAADFLARSIIHTQLCEFFFNGHGNISFFQTKSCRLAGVCRRP